MATNNGEAAAEGQSAPLCGAAAEELPSTILDLPTEVELQIFSSLSAADVAACMATCRAWRTAADSPLVWQRLARRRWQHGGTQSRFETLQQQHRWRQIYAIRRQLDAEVVSLVKQLHWPNQHQAAMRELDQLHFPDVQDLLLCLARPAARLETQQAASDWPDAAAAVAAAPCGIPYWAQHAFEELLAQHWADQLHALGISAEAHARGIEEYSERAQRARAAAGTADSGAESQEQGEQRQGEQRGEHHPSSRDPQRALELSTLGLQQVMEEGALAVAHVHHPFAEIGWVQQAIEALGEELKRRMAAAGVSGGVPALRLLSQLLCGPGPPPRHPHFHSIPPPDGYGLEITGNRERYYDASNSLLDHVLSQREGIPISLALLYAGVGKRAGLPIVLLNVPMHVVCGMEDEGAAAQQTDEATPGQPGSGKRWWFIDVFEGGRIMNRDEFLLFLDRLGMGPARQLPPDLQGMTPSQCWLRMCRNLVHIHRESGEYGKLKAVSLLMAAAAGDGSAEGMRAIVEAANACMALQQYQQAAELLHRLVAGPYQVQLGHTALHAPALHAMLAEIRGKADQHLEQQMRVKRHAGHERVLYRVGQLLRHKRYQYRGVIVGWDPTCRASNEWMQQMGVDRLPGGSQQPFYHVLPDPADRPGQAQTYVAQENIELQALPALHANQPGYALHPDVGRYFSALAPGGERYVLNDWMRYCYPDD